VWWVVEMSEIVATHWGRFRVYTVLGDM
jgi:hypothetical protein